jgi:26S proteasome regulatory subunit N1
MRGDTDVAALKEGKKELYKPSLDQIREFIRTSTSSMTAVPKPLKFLRPHYDTLTKLFDQWEEGEDKVRWSCNLFERPSDDL